MSTTVNVDSAYLPTVELTVADDGRITATIEVDGLEPTRETTAEERAAGITSLDPPTISIRPLSTRARTHRAAIDAAWRAVASSAAATDGLTGGPGGLLMVCLRTTMAIRTALRLAGESI
jgi:hypothetical protein